jgi:uncharacterized protein (TIGR03083 family)
MTATLPGRTAPRAPALDRTTALRLAAEEYRRVVVQLRALTPGDWTRPTDCPGWDVRAMAGHVVGMAEMAAALRQLVAQNLAAARAGGGVDALTRLQVSRWSRLSTGELVDRLEVVGPRAVRGRRRMPSLVRRLPLPARQVVGGERERWTVGFLTDVVLTRDPWMHRMDIARATGRTPELTAVHDGVLVADVVTEWARRHGRPYRLTLTGPAGGSWSVGEDGSAGEDGSVGEDGEAYELDAVEFCRLQSGRGRGDGLLAQQTAW